jgi:hypothetical protein
MFEDGVGGPSNEEMKTPEQREREHKLIVTVVLRRLGTPRPGEEQENEAIASRYATDVAERLAAENITVSETVDVSSEEERLMLCVLSDVQGARTKEAIEEVLATIVGRGMYNFELKPDEKRREKLSTLALIYARASERINEGWDTSMFTKEETAAAEQGEYPTENDL